MNSYTSLEQSKELAEILPTESADMAWYSSYAKGGYSIRMLNDTYPLDIIEDAHDEIPAWSLAALIEQLPIIDGSRPLVSFALNGDCDISYFLASTADVLWTHASNLLDACVEMILILSEKKLINYDN